MLLEEEIKMKSYTEDTESGTQRAQGRGRVIEN
jgi:hypothetical protein